MNNSSQKWQPFIYGILIALGIFIGFILRPSGASKMIGSQNKFNELLGIIQTEYVDTVNLEQIETETFNELLNKLDPHSVYIPARDLQAANEPLDGNFEGIGVEFNIVNDTIMVVSAISGGPSADLGIQSGDRIIKADTTNLAGVKITNEQVVKNLRGKKGSSVLVTIYRPSTKQKIEYNITRNTIPIYSIDASFMLDNKTGYVKISRFGATTHQEFLDAIAKLKKENMQSLVLDLRGNPGGYLKAANDIVDELLNDGKLIVYTQGRAKPKQTYLTEKEGIFEDGKLAVLIDEGSASASEIVSGAIQDWDRGLIIGRRSFGKGLVQEPFELSDGSAIRLTIARYYTPSGRCIQKKYSDGYDKYEEDLMNRFENGELENELKNTINDTTKYYTKIKNRIVYSGGGISPDYKVTIDTSFNTRFLTHIAASGLLNKAAYQYVDANRNTLKNYKSVENFIAKFEVGNDLINQLIIMAENDKITKPTEADMVRSGAFIKQQLKALIARQIWRDGGYFKVNSMKDKTIQKAILELGK
ncbi:MAG: S41 family peptidase [Bacteroidia bacterium]|nr:S41 family peptidase [Bacteroidia bacterium]